MNNKFNKTTVWSQPIQTTSRELILANTKLCLGEIQTQLTNTVQKSFEQGNVMTKIYTIDDGCLNNRVVSMLEQFLVSLGYKEIFNVNNQDDVIKNNIFVNKETKSFSKSNPSEEQNLIVLASVDDFIRNLDPTNIGNFSIYGIDNFFERKLLLDLLNINGYTWDKHIDYIPSEIHGNFLKKLSDSESKKIELLDYKNYSYHELVEKLLFVAEKFGVGDSVYCPSIDGEFHTVKRLQCGSLGITWNMTKHFSFDDNGYRTLYQRRIFREPFVYKVTKRNYQILKIRYPHIKFNLPTLNAYNLIERLFHSGRYGVLVRIDNKGYKYIVDVEEKDDNKYLIVAGEDKKIPIYGEIFDIDIIDQETGRVIVDVSWDYENEKVLYEFKK